MRLVTGLLLVLAFVFAVIAAAPARLLQFVLPGDQVVMQGLSGTLWHGRASRCLLQLPPGYLHLGAVEWSLDPLSLLTLSPRLHLGSAWGQQRVTGEVILRSAKALDVRDLQVSVAASLVQKFAPLALDGALSVDVSELSLRDGLPYSAQGRLVWQDGGFQAPRGRIPLGSYALDFAQPAGSPLRGEVITLAGPLEARGNVELDGRHYAIDVRLGSEYPLDSQLQQALALMARPEGDGYRVVLEADF